MPPAGDRPEQQGVALRVTVGLPVYNDPDGLRDSVPTVFAQSWEGDLRLLVVDDGSTDETPAVLEELTAAYGAIHVIRHPENLGRPRARNRILEEAGDGFLAWIDSDDLWHPRKLELQIATLLAEDPESNEPIICTTPFRWVYSDRDQERVKVPDVSGDQVLKALTGTLHPYLWAMLGRVEVFRQAGGFDERLPRRQDFEFFLRFLDGGGRVVRTPSESPLCTYMKTDVGRSSEEIAAANEIIQQKHEHLYRRYGRRFTLEGRRKRYLLVARFQAHNGQPLRSRMNSVRARALDPLLWAGRPADAMRDLDKAVRRPVRRLRRRLGRIRGRLLGVAARVYRIGRRGMSGVKGRLVASRTAAGEHGLRAGAARLLRPPGVGGNVTATVKRWVRQLPTEDALARTEQLVASGGMVEDPTVWARLEETYRADGKLWSAEQALIRGLDHHPDDALLRVRYIELLSLRRDWQRCVDEWDRRRDQLHGAAKAITYTRIVRALKQLGDVQRATETAAEGLSRWPGDERLLEEHRRNATTGFDWTSAHRSGAPEPPDQKEATTGSTTSLGFLDGGDGPLAGCVEVADEPQPTVELLLNDHSVAWTSADRHGDPEGRATFSLNCGSLGEFLGDGDTIELRCDGRPIWMDEIGPQLEISAPFPSRAEEVLGRVAAGHRFNKFGQLRAGNSPERKRATLDLFDEVSATIADRFGLTCYPFYGNLLGAIREHDFLPHDIGGFDMGYLATSSAPEEVQAEFLATCRVLVEQGFHLTMEPWSAMIRRRHNDNVFLDLNFAWESEDNGLGLSFGWRHEPVTDLARFQYPRRSALADRLVPVPGNAEDVLRQIYGEGWLVPDQGFQLEVELARDDRYLITEEQRGELHRVDPDLVRLRSDVEVDA